MIMEDAPNDIFKIQLKIADKFYPVTCKRSDEKFYRMAASSINDKLFKYGNRYQGAEITLSDLLVMVACDIAISKFRLEEKQDDSPVYDRIEKLDAELSDFIELVR